jgi:endogenous inhibitor of DNA gyrase (YacG/DUF329 family)
MAGKPVPNLRCPICKKPLTIRNPDYPFCSERCRSIDLGKWASGAYVISSPVDDISETVEESRPADSGEED